MMCRAFLSVALRLLLVCPGTVLGQLTFGTGRDIAHVETVYRPMGGAAAAGGRNPFGGIIPGLGLVGLSTAVLWWNEGRTARYDRMLASAQRNVRPLNAPTRAALEESLESVQDGGLVHLSGPLASSGVRDAVFGEMQRSDALRLRRTTEAYQWHEHRSTSERRVSKDHVERTTTYSYTTEWSSSRQASGSFRDRSKHNPEPRLPPGRVDEVARDAHLPNGLHVDADLLTQLGDWQPAPLPRALLPRDGAAVVGTGTGGGGSGDAIYLSAPGSPSPEKRGGSTLEYMNSGGGDPYGGGGSIGSARRLLSDSPTASTQETSVSRYLEAERGENLGHRMTAISLPPPPVVGDARVSFAEVPAPEEGVSILAAVSRSGGLSKGKPLLRPWAAARGASSSSHSSSRRLEESSSYPTSSAWFRTPFSPEQEPSLYLLMRGKVSPGAMLNFARRRGNRVKWAIRAGGVVLMWMGGASLLSFLPALAAYLPLVGGLAQSLVGATTSIVALGGAVAASALVIASAWVRFRPLHACGLALAAIGAALGQTALIRRNAAAARQQPLVHKSGRSV